VALAIYLLPENNDASGDVKVIRETKDESAQAFHACGQVNFPSPNEAALLLPFGCSHPLSDQKLHNT